MHQANQPKSPPQAWRNAFQRARAEVAAGQTVESEAVFAEIAADLDAMQASEPTEPDATRPPRR